MKTSRHQYLQALGITPWELRRAPPGQAEPGSADIGLAASPERAVTAAAAESVDGMDWADLEARVSACRQCGLDQTRTQTVFGVGNRSADWLIVGEAPGADEDRQGEPFVGRAGQLLNAMLAATGRGRADVFIANILKCRPPGNRDPRPEEVVCCEPFLARQIALIRPRLILALGRIAAQNLLRVDTPVGRLRGQVHAYGAGDIPLVVTYHPAYLLRSPEQKAKAWQDLKLAMSVRP